MTIEIPKQLKLKCWNYLKNNNMGNRHSANGNKEQQFVGLIGEVLTKKIFKKMHTFENGFDGGYDFIHRTNKIDVKTMGRTVDVKDYFVHNFIAFQETYDCDIYIFNSLNKKIKNLIYVDGLQKQIYLRTQYFIRKVQ